MTKTILCSEVSASGRGSISDSIQAAIKGDVQYERGNTYRFEVGQYFIDMTMGDQFTYDDWVTRMSPTLKVTGAQLIPVWVDASTPSPADENVKGLVSVMVIIGRLLFSDHKRLIYMYNNSEKHRYELLYLAEEESGFPVVLSFYHK